MKIYRYRTNANQFACVEFRGNYPENGKPFLNCERIGDVWTPLELRVDLSQGPLADFPALEAVIPVFSPKARDALRGLIEKSVEFLPVWVAQQSYFAVNVLSLVDALDKPKCTFRRYSNGLIADVTNYAFKPEVLRGTHIFKLPETKFGEVLVSDQFVEAVTGANLIGLRPLLVWSEDLNRETPK
ncbi:MAG TPA: DUF1629 domain-containing protein [Clostridia bacterium]|nr:DUF1629 domain-containing protein [Clostridia bacterium]